MPKIINKDVIKQRLIDYIDSVPDPNLPEFCSMYNDNPHRDTLYDWSNDDEINKTYGFRHLLKRLHDKQESFLIRAKDVNPIMAIFRLKQPSFGYKDKQELDITTSDIVIIPPKRPD
jgi:hypothetical protein